MKNEDIKPGDLVPAEIRLQVYEEAMNAIESNKQVGGLREHWLCLLLPCILWDLKDYKLDAPCGKEWLIMNTTDMFPELTYEVIMKLEPIRNKTQANAKRIEFLRGAILSLMP